MIAGPLGAAKIENAHEMHGGDGGEVYGAGDGQKRRSLGRHVCGGMRGELARFETAFNHSRAELCDSKDMDIMNTRRIRHSRDICVNIDTIKRVRLPAFKAYRDMREHRNADTVGALNQNVARKHTHRRRRRC